MLISSAYIFVNFMYGNPHEKEKDSMELFCKDYTRCTFFIKRILIRVFSGVFKVLICG